MQRGIDGVSFGKISHGGAPRIDVRKVSSPPEYSLDISAFARLLDRAFDEGVHTRIGAQVSVYQSLGLAARYAKAFAQAEGANAVYYAEIGGLCLAALVVGDGAFVLVEDFGGCGAP